MGVAPSAPASSATPTATAAFTCPANNNALYVSGTQRTYRLGCNTDFSGSDQGWSAGSGLLDCIKQCELQPGCSAVVYAWNGACYFKGSDAQYKYSAGNQAAILSDLIGGKPLGAVATSTTSSVFLTTSAKTTTSTTSRSSVSSSSKTSSAPATTTMTSSMTTSKSTSSSSLSSSMTTLIIKASTSKSGTTTSSSTASASPSVKSLTFLPMGDSITWGYLANESYNSYRLALIDLLTGTSPLWTTNQTVSSAAMYQAVHAVGSIYSGNFTENASEGNDGGEIDLIQSDWLARYQNYTRTPDVATILAGIHDIADNVTDVRATQALQRIDTLIANLFLVYPNITVVVSTLTPVTVTSWQPGVAAFNAALPGLVQNRTVLGQKVLMVDAASALNLQTDIADFVHPNAQGYRKLAQTFYAGLQSAAAKKWLP